MSDFCLILCFTRILLYTRTYFRPYFSIIRKLKINSKRFEIKKQSADDMLEYNKTFHQMSSGTKIEHE